MAVDPVAFERRVWEVLSSALGLEGRAREECLETIRSTEPDVHREVTRRLSASDRLGSFLDQPAVPRSPRVSPQDSLFATGDTFGPYVIQSELGRGGMGSVYLATDTQVFGRSVALKLLSQTMQRQADARERFDREAKAIAALRHHFICQIHGYGENQGQPYIAMEYVDGETLQARLRGGALAPKDAVGIGLEVAEALEAAHAQGIVHRDLKPANIMLAGGHVKVLDFGVAKIVGSPPGDDAPTVEGTNPGFAVGTWDYMSPEQRRAEAVDARSDIYSLGLVLFEMLTGQRPGALSEFGSEIPEALQRVVRRMLAESPDERYQSARDLREALEHVRDAPDARDRARTLVAPEPPVPWRMPVRRAAAWVGAGVTAVIVSIALWPEGGPRSVAVPPFRDLTSGSAELTNLLPRAITTRLGQAGIDVATFEDALLYGDTPASEVARELNVDTVLQATVESTREGLVVTPSLNARGRVDWTDEFDYESFGELAGMIAEAVARELGYELSPDQVAILRTPESESDDAVEFYSTGADYLRADDGESVTLAIGWMEDALELDPDYVEAHVGLGTAYARMFWNGWGEGVANLQKAEDSFRKAFDTARELGRTDMRALRGLMQVHYYRGEGEEVLRLLSELEGSREDDVEVLLARAQAFALAGLTSEAVRLLEECLALDPENESAMWFLAVFSNDDGTAAERYLERFGFDTWVHVAAALASRNDREEARRHFDLAVRELTEQAQDEDLVLQTGWYELSALLHAGAFYERELSDSVRARALWGRGRDLVTAKLENDPDHPGLLLFLAGFHGFLGERDAFENAEQRALEAMRNADLRSPHELLALAAAKAHQVRGGSEAEAVATLIQRLDGGRLDDLDHSLGNLVPELLSSFAYRTKYLPASVNKLARLRELQAQYAPAVSQPVVAGASAGGA